MSNSMIYTDSYESTFPAVPTPYDQLPLPVPPSHPLLKTIQTNLIVSLTNEVRVSDASNQFLSEVNTAFESRIESLESELTAVKEMSEYAEARLAQKSEEAKEIQEALYDALTLCRGEAADARQRVVELEKELEGSKIQIMKFIIRNVNEKLAKAETTGEIVVPRRGKKVWKEVWEQMRALYQSLQQVSHRLVHENLELMEQIKELKTRVQNFEAENRALGRKVYDLKESSSRLDSKNKNLRAKVENLEEIFENSNKLSNELNIEIHAPCVVTSNSQVADITVPQAEATTIDSSPNLGLHVEAEAVAGAAAAREIRGVLEKEIKELHPALNKMNDMWKKKRGVENVGEGVKERENGDCEGTVEKNCDDSDSRALRKRRKSYKGCGIR